MIRFDQKMNEQLETLFLMNEKDSEILDCV